MDFDGYKIVRQAIARGSAGVVHEAISPDGERVAIKVLNKEAIEEAVARRSSLVARPKTAKIRWSLSITGEDASSSDTEEIDITEETRRVYEKNVERFKEEYRIIIGFKHPNVAEVRKIGFFDGHLYFVSEFIDGKPLAEHVRGWKPADMTKLFLQALEGLDFIHKNGLIHLDIKSQNVLVHEVDGVARVKIIDFGMAMSPAEYDGKFMGTPSYIAPEVALGKRELVDARSDLFSFGVLMYHCITWGAMPFARPKGDVEKLRRDLEHRIIPDPPSHAHSKYTAEVPKHFDTIVMRLIEHDPKDRFYGSARAVMNALLTGMADQFCGSPDVAAAYLTPEGNRHIGHEEEQAKIRAAVDTLAVGEAPKLSIIAITGAQGTGKSHLLNKIKEYAERYAEKIAIKRIELPADETALKRFTEDITLWASENKLPAVVLIDGLINNFPLATNLINSISERESNPKLYSGIKPLILVFTKDCHSEALAEESRQTIFTIKLHPFTSAELKKYLASTPAFKGKEVPDKKVTELHTLTGGIQAEIVERLRESDSKGLIFNLDGGIVMSDLKRRENAPATTEARLIRTYEGLLPDERHILDFMSVCGIKGVTPPPDFETVSRLVSSSFVAMRISKLVDKEILKKTSTNALMKSRTYALSFTNPYFSTLIYNRMGESEKLRWHDAIAKHLSSVIARSPKGDVAISSLLLHRGLGSNRRLALKSLVKLAKTQLYDNGRADFAAWLLERAELLVEKNNLKLKIHLKSLQAAAKFFEGKFGEVQKITEDGMSFLHGIAGESGGIGISLRVWDLFSLVRQQRHGEAAKKIEELICSRGAKRNDIFYPTLLNLKAFNLYSRSFVEPGAATPLLTQARELYNSSKSLEKNLPVRNATRINTNNLGAVLTTLGELSGAAKEFEDSLAIKEHTVFSRIASLVALAEARRLIGENDRAMVHARDALRLASASGLGAWLVHAHGTIANIYHDMDRFDDAIEEDRRYLAASSCIEDEDRHRQTSVRLWVHMGHCCKEKKDHDLAILHFEAAIEAGAKGFELMSAHLGLGESNHRKGKLDEAKKHLSKAKALLDLLPGDASAKSHLARIEKLQKEIGFEKGVS